MKPRNFVGLFLALACAAVVLVVVVYRSRPAVTIPLSETLRQAPGVVRVDAALSTENTPCQIVHILDYRFVPRERYGPTGYAEHLARIEAVQDEQLILLRWLVTNLGVSEVFVEGLTEENLPAFFEQVRAVDETDSEEIPRLMDQFVEARAKNAARAAQLEAVLGRLMEAHRERLLALGGAGRMSMTGKLDLRPLDDARLLRLAKPRFVSGQVVVDPDVTKARHDAMVRNALKSGEPVVVILAGAGHDLTESVRAHDPQCEYIRLTTRKVGELIGSR